MGEVTGGQVAIRHVDGAPFARLDEDPAALLVNGGNGPAGGAEGAEFLAERGEGAAGVDLGELAVVTDEDDLGAVRACEVEELCELTGPNHACFVDDEDIGVEPAAVMVATRSSLSIVDDSIPAP